jgi:uncharacterized protein
MKKIAASIVAAVALMGAAPAFAQADAASTAAARELFDSMNYRSVMIDVMKQMTQGLGQSIRAGSEAAIKNDTKLTSDQQREALLKMEAELPAVTSKLQAIMNDPALVDEILAETVPLYARTFNAAELKQMAAFYRTPVGAKMLATMPKLMGEGMQLGQQVVLRRIGPIMQKLQQEHAQAQQAAK